MKRLFSVFVSVVMVILLAGCGKKEEPASINVDGRILRYIEQDLTASVDNSSVVGIWGVAYSTNYYPDKNSMEMYLDFSKLGDLDKVEFFADGSFSDVSGEGTWHHNKGNEFEYVYSDMPDTAFKIYYDQENDVLVDRLNISDFVSFTYYIREE